ncbi:MAG: glutamine-hydrolyzing carbamoyl-phosphate synthase small subunit [Clostridia bacterium]|nr:glutamine-hydrolyzing carbamoyl-phosphate synthase small subunit [Clostridia bacterium]
MQKAYLVLENGKVFEGVAFGQSGEATGEIVFNTGMVGYGETLTDPCYYGQMVVQTFPLIGNYGIISEDVKDKKSYVKGYIVRNFCDAPSNFRCDGLIDDYLKAQGVVGISGIDTRELTKLIRDAGTVRGKIVTDISDLGSIINEIKGYENKGGVAAAVSSDKAECVKGDGRYHVVVYNFGAMRNLVSELSSRDCKVTVVPYSASAEEVITLGADGVVISDGPGDPMENTAAIAEIKKIADSGIPVFGISLGHQILALAMGAKTVKHKYGHRGANQPVKFIDEGRVLITSQNHGYNVEPDTLPAGARVSFVNVNDGTCEGIEYAGKKAFSVQFLPSTCDSPHSTGFLFDKLIKMIEEEK